MMVIGFEVPKFVLTQTVDQALFKTYILKCCKGLAFSQGCKLCDSNTM